MSESVVSPNLWIHAFSINNAWNSHSIWSITNFYGDFVIGLINSVSLSVITSFQDELVENRAFANWKHTIILCEHDGAKVIYAARMLDAYTPRIRYAYHQTSPTKWCYELTVQKHFHSAKLNYRLVHTTYMQSLRSCIINRVQMQMIQIWSVDYQ